MGAGTAGAHGGTLSEVTALTAFPFASPRRQIAFVRFSLSRFGLGFKTVVTKQWLGHGISTFSQIHIERRINYFHSAKYPGDAPRQIHHFAPRHDDFAFAVSQFNPFFFHSLFHSRESSIFLVD